MVDRRSTAYLCARPHLDTVAVTWIIQQQQEQYVPRLNEIAGKETTGLIDQPEDPFQSHPARPPRRRRDRTSDILEGGPIGRKNYMGLSRAKFSCVQNSCRGIPIPTIN